MITSTGARVSKSGASGLKRGAHAKWSAAMAADADGPFPALSKAALQARLLDL